MATEETKPVDAPEIAPQPPTPMDTETDEKKDKTPTSKKRKRPSPKKETQTAPSAAASAPLPSHILVIDNGGDTVKYGFLTNRTPLRLPNVTARLQHQWTVLVGDEVNTVAPNQLESLVRSTERGYIVNLGNQVQVWKRLLDNMGVAVPLTSEAAQAFGWKVSRGSKAQSPTSPLISPQSIAVLLLVPPFCPRSVLEQMMQVWFQDFGVSRVGFAVSSECASKSAAPTDTNTRCVVDIGWSSMTIVPTHDGKIINIDCIRHVPVGGRHLVNLYKYYTSYRQWNLMDQEFLLRDVLQQLGYLSLQFEDELKTARRLPLGRRPYDRDYILPDYQTTHRGQVVVPAALQRQREAEQATAETAVPEAVEEDAEESSGEDESEGPTKKSEKKQAKEEDDIESEEEETEEEMRRRILKQRQEEERRKRQQELEQQILQVSVERFTIPETLFHPSDAGLSPDIAGLPQAVCSSIAACPPIYRAALYQSVFLTGGLSQLCNFQARLDRDLRSLAPSQYEVTVDTAVSPIDAAWLGAREWAQKTPCMEWSVGFGEWESSKKKASKEWHRLLHQNGGRLV